MYLSGMTPQGVLQHAGSGADHVDAGRQDPHDVAHRVRQPVVAHRAVHRAVGPGRQHRVQIVGGDDTRGHVEPGQLAGILAHLGIRFDTNTGQLELWVFDELGQRESATVSGADERDADGHAASSGKAFSCRAKR
jgi:hypothetical protein